MAKKIILIGLFVAALGYAAYTYWPLLSSLLPKKEPVGVKVESPIVPQGLVATKQVQEEEKTAPSG
ncbi:MAG: hypothetical protein HQ596_06655, partial [Candidatus Saganbacteria bacterium]|nr:hypothetical protein [Candidatus Saganbacteria bacterium]